MPTRSTSRVYNRATLEIWFENVGLEWECHFTEEILERGRRIYRESKITGVELGERDAIVHCAFARKDTCYAVIEWGVTGPEIRTSTGDSALGRAVAVAGLYEIEELIADEIAPLPYVSKGKVRAEAVPLEKFIEPEPEESGSQTRPSRRLTPCLEGLCSGLRVTAYWTNPDFTKEPALHTEGAKLASAEREAIVRLTGHLHNSGFHYRMDDKDFLLADPEKILPFFKHNLKHLEECFDFVDLDSDARLMAEGIREVKIVGRVESAGQDTMKIDCRLKFGRKWLDRKDAGRLARAGCGTHIVKGLGLVRIVEEQSEVLAEWRGIAGAGGAEAGTWPRYMVFSLFGNRGAELDLKEEMKRWHSTLLPQPEGGDVVEEARLPEFLRDYQAHGVRWLANLRKHGCHGLLADEMGLGKTLQVLTLLHFYSVGEKNNLIVCPASVIPVWESEAQRWYPGMETAVLRSGNVFNDPRVDSPKLWIASYTQIRRHKHLLDEMEFGYAVLDEAQQIKNPDTKVTHACCAIRSECRIALTGTPLENRLLDLWTIFRFLMPGLLGSRHRFEEEMADVERQAEFERHLKKQIAPFILRRQKDKVGKDLPPKVEMNLICPITDVQRQTYERLLARGREELGDDLRVALQKQTMNLFTLLIRLRQACCDPGLIPEIQSDITQSGKIQTLLIHLEEALAGAGARKVVIFSQFVQLLKRLKPLIKKAFPKVALLELTGRTRDRRKPVQTFQEKEGPSVILVSLRAGGTGITLHAADYVFLLDPWWNPAVENQAVDRVHRIGQSRRVFVYRMITQGTIEERIQHLKKEKGELFEKTLGNLGSASDLVDHFTDFEELAKLLPEMN